MRYPTNLAPLLAVAIGFISSHRTSAEEKGIDLFSAIGQGDVTVRFIALNAGQANVLIKNELDKPLRLKLPKAIAAVPVLGQFGQNPNQNQNGNPAGGSTNQGVGGGFNIGNGQGQGNGQGFGNQQDFGRGIMRIAPGKTHKLSAKTVCLEHGKPDPKPRIAYRIIPLETFTTDPIITFVCQQLSTGQIPPDIAQAIVWHHGNQLPWTQLAALDRMQSRYRGNIKLFTPEDLDAAKSLYASLSSKNESPGDRSSLPAENTPTSAADYAWSISDGNHSSYSTSRSGHQSICR